MNALHSLLIVVGFLLGTAWASPLIRIGDWDGFHPLLKWIFERNPQYRLSNWGGNFQFSTRNVQYPRSTDEVKNLVKNSYMNIRAIGTRHSFSKIGDSDEMIISTSHLNQVLGIDPANKTVTVEAGMTYTDLAPFLEIMGFGLPNLASLAEISVTGAAQTAAHGSGVNNKILASSIRAMKLVLANGTVTTIEKGKNDNELAAMRVGLGAFGIITEITLEIIPRFDMAQNVFLNMSVDYLTANFDAVTGAAYSVQFFYDYADPNIINQVFVFTRTTDANHETIRSAPNFYGAKAATTQQTPIPELPATYLAEQQGSVAPWYMRLVDYRLGLSGFNGEEIQSEYFVPWVNATKAIKAMKVLAPQIRPVAYVGLYRTVAADDIWMSHSYNKKTLAFHWTWRANVTAVLAILPKIEAILDPLGAVPHWGKLYTSKPSTYLRRYPKLNDWKAMVANYDPNRKFRNDFLNTQVFVNV